MCVCEDYSPVGENHYTYNIRKLSLRNPLTNFMTIWGKSIVLLWQFDSEKQN